MNKLHSLSKKKNLTYTKLKEGIDKFGKEAINLKQKDGVTPLMLLCKHNPNLKFIELFINSGADVNILDDSRMNCLYYLFIDKNNFYPTAVEYLHNQGCNIGVTDSFNHTILHRIIIEKRFTKEKLQTLLKFKPDMINKRGIYLNTPLMRMIRHYPKFEYMKMLIDHGADINILDSSGTTCLVSSIFCANVKESIDMIKYLISKGINLYQKDNNGNIPLHHASAYNKESIEFLKIFFHPNYINCKNNNNQTPLMSFMKKYGRTNYKILKFFLDNGADPTIINDEGFDCLFYQFNECIYFSPKCVKLLVDKGCNINQEGINGNKIENEIFGGSYINVEKLKVFLKICKDLNIKVELEKYHVLNKLFHYSSKYIQLTKLILEFGYKGSDYEKKTYLHKLIYSNCDIDKECEKIIKHLFEKGFEIKLTHEGKNIIHSQDFKPPTIRKIYILGVYGVRIKLSEKKINKDFKYLNFKCKFQDFCTYQLFY